MILNFIFNLQKLIHNNFIKQLYNYFTSVNVNILKIILIIHYIKQIKIFSGSSVFQSYKLDDKFLNNPPGL